MKNQIRHFVVGAGLAALLIGPSLMAQNSETAEIPFDFHAGKLSLPAGTYTVENAVYNGVLQLRNEDSRHSIFLGSQGRESAKYDAKLSFRCYNGNCFLSEVWMPGSPAYMFVKSSLEKEIEKSGTKLAMAYVPLATR
jgi:hypothetical protein